MALKRVILKDLSIDGLVRYLDLCGYVVRLDYEFVAARILIDNVAVDSLIRDLNMEGLCAWSKPAEFSGGPSSYSFVYVK